METTQSSDSIPRANAMAERQKRGLANLAPEGGKDTDAMRGETTARIIN